MLIYFVLRAKLESTSISRPGKLTCWEWWAPDSTACRRAIISNYKWYNKRGTPFVGSKAAEVVQCRAVNMCACACAPGFRCEHLHGRERQLIWTCKKVRCQCRRFEKTW